MWLLNAVSTSIFEYPANFRLQEISVKSVRKKQLESRIGHADLALELSNLLHREIECSRADCLKLKSGESAIIAHVHKTNSGRKELKFFRLDVL